MKRLASFLKATTFGGLFVVLPVIVVLVLIAKVLLTLRGATQSLMEALAGKGSPLAQLPMLSTIVLLCGVAFLFGLAMTSRRGTAAGRWFERGVLLRVPGYAAVRAIIGGLVDDNREGAVKPGLLQLADGIDCFVLIIEDHGDGQLTIYLPGSPNPGSGNVQIVRKDLVRLLNVRMRDVPNALQQWGMGSAKILGKHQASLAELRDGSAS